MPLYKKGDLIVREKMCVGAVDPALFHGFCARCLKWVTCCRYRCKGCRLTFYCDEECAKRDEPLHKGECRFLSAVDYFPSSTHERLLLRLLTSKAVDYRDFLPASNERYRSWCTLDSYNESTAEMSFDGLGALLENTIPISKSEFVRLFAEVCPLLFFC